MEQQQNNTDLEIIMMPLDALKPYENNTRHHTEADIAFIKNSIEEFGMNDPIGIWGDENIIVEGHGRLLALQELGYTEAPCIRLDHLTEEQRKAYTIAHNSTAEASSWDLSKLSKELKDIQNISMDNFNVNFNNISLNTIRQGKLITEDKDYIDSVIKEYQDRAQEKITRESREAEEKYHYGDIYKLGNHYLMLGDSTSQTDMDTLRGLGHITMMITDPPYGVNIVHSNDRHSAGGDGGTADKYAAMSTINSGKGTAGKYTAMATIGKNRDKEKNIDIKSEYKYSRFEEDYNKVEDNIGVARMYKPVIGDNDTEITRKFWEIIKNDDYNKVIFGGNYFTEFLPFSSNYIIWNKKTEKEGAGHSNFKDAEIAWCDFNSHERVISCEGIMLLNLMWGGISRYKGNAKYEDKMSIDRFHPTQKPVKLFGEIMEEFTEEGDTIFDPFGGSGSSLIAAEKTNRNMIMMEYDPYYFSKIITRWEAYTGNKAEKYN